jgi:simple sugar transport system permease protein
MQRVVQVPSALITALNGLVVVFVVGSEILRRRMSRRDVLDPPESMPAGRRSEASGEP